MSAGPRSTAVAAVALVILASAGYLGSLGHPLMHDDRTRLDSAWLAERAGPVEAFKRDFWYGTRHEGSDLYRPVTILSLAWNRRVAASREGFRGVNLALHAVAVLAVAAWLAWIVRRLGDLPHDRAQAAVFIGAALFAVHPLGSEAVLWAVGRAEMLAAIFGIVAFLGFTSSGSAARRWAGAAAWFLALGSKESAASWPLLAAAAWALTPRTTRPRLRELARRALPYGLALAAFVLLRGTAVGWGTKSPPFVDNPLVGADAATRIANAVLLHARMAGKALWPATLSVEYGYDQIPVVPWVPWGAVGAAAVLAAWAAIARFLRRFGPAAVFLWCVPPLASAVTGHLLFPIGTIAADRLAYLPLAGWCGLAGYALAAIPAPAWRRALPVAAILAALGARTWVRSGDYRDLATFHEATAAASPRAVKALANVGRTRLKTGRAAEAVEPLERAVAILPGYARAWSLLAEAYAATGRREEAAAAASRAGAVDGDDDVR